ncbi:hypothetical protein [Gemella haemolysans]|uniref:hypothetical protein n=1 Tax=Gemella haemolysans TaxID=1379 RepID=UPI0028D41FAC|nr:hypothetical protein [Gemella haemolysans]
MIDNLEYEISEFLKKQPNMILEREETRYIIKGRYICTLDSRGYIVDVNKKIKIVIENNFPNSIPKLFLYEYPEGMRHIYNDGGVCLASTGELINSITRTPSIIYFIKKFINSFLFSLVWYEKYKTYPFGEREHGYKGLLDYYLNDLKLNKTSYIKMYFMIKRNQYIGNSKCFCFSKKKLKDCHGKYILPIMKNKLLRNEFLIEGKMIITEDNKNGSKKPPKFLL